MANSESRREIVYKFCNDVYTKMNKAGRFRPQKFGEVCEVISSINFKLAHEALDDELKTENKH